MVRQKLVQPMKPQRLMYQEIRPVAVLTCISSPQRLQILAAFSGTRKLAQ